MDVTCSETPTKSENKPSQLHFFHSKPHKNSSKTRPGPKLRFLCCSFEKGYTGDDKFTDDVSRITEYCFWQYGCYRLDQLSIILTLKTMAQVVSWETSGS